jgi:hypothetical protein
MARQIHVATENQELTDDKHLAYGYFSQVLLPDYIEQSDTSWDVVRQPATSRAAHQPAHRRRDDRDSQLPARDEEVLAAEFANANVDIIGPSGNVSAVIHRRKDSTRCSRP